MNIVFYLYFANASLTIAAILIKYTKVVPAIGGRVPIGKFV